jgi:hypothetical protein
MWYRLVRTNLSIFLGKFFLSTFKILEHTYKIVRFLKTFLAKLQIPSSKIVSLFLSYQLVLARLSVVIFKLNLRDVFNDENSALHSSLVIRLSWSMLSSPTKVRKEKKTSAIERKSSIRIKAT